MFEFTCAYCGNVKQVPRRHDIGKWCSKSCADKARKGQKTKYNLKRDNGEYECLFQPESIVCTRMDCENCGWNPEVAEARLKRIMEEL